MPYSTIAPSPGTRLSDAVCTQLEQLIIDGRLRPGQALPAERGLALRLGVSRPSLREALLKLEARGIIHGRHGGGFAVNDVTAPTLTDPLVHLVCQYPRAAEDVLEMRHGLEPVAAALAAQRATRGDLRRLKLAFKRMTTGSDDADALEQSDADAEFHLTIAEASHNLALIHVTRGFFNLLRKTVHGARSVLMQENHAASLALHEQHAALLHAIAAGDPAAARHAAHTHVDFVLAGLRRGKGAPPLARLAREVDGDAQDDRQAATVGGGKATA